MRDPLYRVSVRYKLALLFVGLSLLTYGLGGFLVSSDAAQALEEQILTRLEFQALAHARSLDAGLELLARRTDDFASDGLIRGHTARIQAADDPAERARLTTELREHLARNKLPLVQAFANLAVAAPTGELLVAVHADASALQQSGHGASAEATGVSELLAAPDAEGTPQIALATPLRAVESSDTVGRLLVLVRVDDWVAPALAGSAAVDQAGDVQLILHDGSGERLLAAHTADGQPLPLRRLAPGPAGGAADVYAPVRGVLSRSFPLTASGWSVEVTLDAGAALLPISGLRSRFVGIGLLLGLASMGLMFFPMRFVARPLDRLRRAADSVREGHHETRVPVESEDEIGVLSASFNHMAEAIQERTHSLERAANELRESEADVRQGRDRLQAVISSMRDGLVVLDGQGAVVMSNGAAAPLAGWLASGEPARSHHVCKEGEPAEAVPTARSRAQPPGGHGEQDCFACLVGPGGPPRSCMVDVGPRTFEVHTAVLPMHGSGQGRVLVAREVTDRIRQDEREMHNERLAVLGEVAAVMAHELNNPLASISMFNQLLASELAEDSPLRENTEVIRRNTDAAKRTIRELLDYATGASPEVGRLDVHDVLEDVLRFLRPLSKRAGVEVRLQAQAQRSEVSADEVQLRQVFVNLTLNAVQALSQADGRSADGAARERFVELSTRDDGERLLIEVRDNGPGIPEDLREHVFRPFYTTKARGEGTGLGLPTARRITEMHGGSLELICTGEQGTTFRVRLRARQLAESGA